MAVIQGSSVDRNIYLALEDIPALGVDPSSVVCKFKKDGADILTTKTLDGTNWIELGNGFYTLRFSPGNMDTAGFFFYTLESPEFDNFLFDEFTIEPAPSLVSPLIPPEVCIVSGNLLTLGAQLPNLTRVLARPVEFPARSGSSLLSSDPTYTFADAEGAFSLRLIRNSVVVIEIDRAGIRHQITVPDQATADLIELLPPSIVDYG